MAGTVTLPPANCGLGPTNNCLIFNSFQVYSLALLNFQAGAGPVGPQDPFAVSTNGTNLQNALVVGTGVNGAGSINTDITGNNADDAYRTPTAQGGGITNFVPSALNQGAQGSAIPTPPQSPNTWDINIAALNTYLNGGNMVFYFNLNQTNSQATTFMPVPQDALGWLSVTLTNSVTHATSTPFLLDGNLCNGIGGNCDPGQSIPQTIDPSAAILPAGEDWAYIHGAICVTPGGAVFGFGACAPGDHVNTTVNQNLGANLAAFGLFSPALQAALDAALLSGAYDVMSVDFRMAALTNGYEQLLIYSSLATPIEVPEPVTITLFGAGLAGLGLLGRRRRRKA
jgi:hypothetical protein